MITLADRVGRRDTRSDGSAVDLNRGWMGRRRAAKILSSEPFLGHQRSPGDMGLDVCACCGFANYTE